jgi:uncharacterized OsmC-like protein
LKLTSEITGEVELDEKVLVLKRIHAHYRLRAREDQREVIERVHAMHVSRCPVARSLIPAITVSTSYELVS